ncbi:DUF4129 domain-containing protein [Thermomicrobium sp.]
MLPRPDPLTIALVASALAAEALAVAPLVAWLAVLSGADPLTVPGWLSLAATGLVSYGLARLVLARTRDPSWSRFLASGGWLLWTLGWWAARGRSVTAIPGFFDGLLDLDAPAVSLAILSALAWWRALVLASEPHPFQGTYLRWAITRDLLLAGGATILAAASGGAAAQAVWHRLELGVPLLLAVRLLTAVLVQAEAVRLAYPATISSVRWITWSAILTLGIVCLAALASLVAGPTLWPHLARPVTWLLTLIVAVLVTLAVLLAVLIWTALRLLVWIVQAIAGQHEPGPPPSLPALPDLLRPRETLAHLALPVWLERGFAALTGLLLALGLLVLIARAFRRFRSQPIATSGSEFRERVSLGSVRDFLPALRWSGSAPRLARRVSGLPYDVRSAYRAALVLLAARGFVRRDSETPLELAHRVTSIRHDLAQPLQDLTARYLVARYAEREDPRDRAAALEDWRELARRLAEET